MGYDFITGPELVRKFQNHLLHTHYVDHKIAEVEKIEELNDGFKITTSEADQYESNALIIATGMTRRKLDIPGEEKFQRKGVFYGNIQDYSFVQGSSVGVIGGGNSALQIVEKLEKIAKDIYLFTDFELTADHALVDRVKTLKKLKIYENTKVLEFEGEKVLSGVKVRVKESGEIIQIPVSGIFISIGMHPNSALVRKLVKLNDQVEIIINKDCSTSHPGIFAAGDVTDAFGKRIIIASGEGAKAALAVRKYVIEHRKKSRTYSAYMEEGRTAISLLNPLSRPALSTAVRAKK